MPTHENLKAQTKHNGGSWYFHLIQPVAAKRCSNWGNAEVIEVLDYC